MHSSRAEHRLPDIPLIHGASLAGAILALLLFSRTARAEMILDAELRLNYESNVVGLLSEQRTNAGTGRNGGPPGPMMAPGQPGTGMAPGGMSGAGSQTKGDVSSSLSAEVGESRDVNDITLVFAKVFAGHTAYDTYTDFNTTVAGAGAGLDLFLSEYASARIMALGKIKRFGDHQRDSEAFGWNLSFKEQFSRLVWFREFAEYEQSEARNELFSYNGTKIGAEVGYQVARKDALTLGFSYLDQMYEDPPSAELKTRTLYLSGEHRIAKSWSVAVEYDVQSSSTNDENGTATDKIFSMALRYNY